MDRGYLAFRRIFEPSLAPEGDGSGGGGGGEGGGSNPGDAGGGQITFTPEQQRYLNSLIAKEKREAKAAAEAEARAEADRIKAEADRQAQIDADKAKGNFEQAEATLKARITELEQERDALKATNQQFTDAMKVGVDARWGELPEKITKLYKGGEDDVLGRWSYLNDPDVVELSKELAGEKKETPNGSGGEAPPRTTTTSGDPKADEAARAANFARYA